MSEGLHFTVTSGHWGPMVRIKLVDGKIKHIEGPLGNFLFVISEKMNFTYDLIHPADGRWGSVLENGSFTGMMGILQREEADISLGPMTIYESRKTVADFAYPMIYNSMSVLYKRPKISKDPLAFVKPFDYQVWIGILLSLISLGFILNWIAKKEFQLFNFPDYFYRKVSVIISMLMSFAALCNEGTDWIGLPDGTRLLFVTWSIICVILLRSYEGLLTALFAIPKVEIPFDTLAQMVQQTEMPWRFEKYTYAYERFEKSTNPLDKIVFDGKEGVFAGCYNNRTEIINGEFIGICDEIASSVSMSWDFSQHGTCNLYLAKERVVPMLMSVCTKKGFKYMKQLDYWSMKMMESGLLNKWIGEGRVNASTCLRSPSSAISTQFALGMDIFGGTFIVPFIGYCLATVAFLGELLMNKITQ